MVQFTIVSASGATLCRLTLHPSATVAELLQQIFAVKPELRASTRFIINRKTGAMFAVSGAATETLQEARLALPDATHETLVFSSTSSPVPAAAAAAAPAIANNTTTSSSSTVQTSSVDAATARMLALFGAPPANATSAVPTPQQQQQQQQQEHPRPSAEDSVDVDPALLDPAQAEMQRRLYAYIQQQQIDENLANALEYTPEAFAKVIMLYVPCTINQVPIKAFVDSGAQMSIMNRATAERCGLMRLVDTRMRGVAVGVGRQEILGRIHMAPVNLSNMHIPFSFSVIADQDIDLIIGLDQLKRHQMVIDLQHNCLRIDTVQVPFLSESEIPKRAGVDVEEAGVEEGGEVPTGAGAEEDQARPHAAPHVIPPPVIQQQQQQQQQQQSSLASASVAATASDAAPAPVQVPHAVSPAPSPAAHGVESEVLTEVQKELKVGDFMEFTGITDQVQARELLEAVDWDPDAAAALYFEE